MQARSTGEPELLEAQRRRREQREGERGAAPRRARRRRQSTPWLQRNALSVAAISILIAFLGLGFGLLQMMNRSDAGLSPLALAQADLAAPTSGVPVLSAAAVGGSSAIVVAPDSSGVSAPSNSAHAIQTTAKVLEPDYTIAAGDTLVKIAQRYNTTVERIQAFNNLSDPRALRIGARLVIPPPL
jgi:LysM repeat protein